MRLRDIVSAIAVFSLCLPSLGGGIALLANSMAHRPVADWGMVSSLAVAIAAMFGLPTILIAIVLCAYSVFSVTADPRVKLASVLILGLAIAASFSVSLRFPL
jgi:hypothetical protein